MSRPDNPSSFSITGGEGLDVVADHLPGATEVAGLGNADAVDMQLPSVLPALGRTTTATCSPQGQYHFWWSSLPAWG